MMRLYMSSSTFITGEFAILVTIISKGCNGYGAVCGYYKFCFMRDFPTVTKSPPLPQLPSSTHPLMHKHTCFLTHTLPIYSMWCTNTHASKHTEPISAYICKYTHTHTHLKAERNQEIWWSCPWPFNWAESGAASPTIWLLIWPSFNYSQISGSSNQFVHKHVQLTWKYGFPSRRKIAIYIENPKSSRLCVYVIFCVLCCFLGVCFEWVLYTIWDFCCNICVFMFFVRSCTVLYW